MDKYLLDRLSTEYEFVRRLIGVDKFYIAGGFVRDLVAGDKPKDYDVFIPNYEDWLKAKISLESFNFTAETERVKSIQLTKDDVSIDLVQTDAGSGQGVIDDFDFTVCAASYGPDGLVTHPDFFEDVNHRRIKINCVKLPWLTLQRAAKFQKRGYSIDTDTKLDMFDYAMRADWGADVEERYNSK